MSSIVNIGAGNSDDAFYRYKMPLLQSKIEGRGNGIKTNITNMVEVAKALARPATYTTKFFGLELGAQSKHEPASGVSIVNGAHETSKLQQLLEGFIKRFVQCYNCGNPETVMSIDKTEAISMRCKACGNVSKVDMRHKLTTFIIKNPPENKETKVEKKLRKAEEARLKEGDALGGEAVAAEGSVKKKAGGDEELRKAIKALKKQVKAAEEAGDEVTRKKLKKELKKLKEQQAADDAPGGDIAPDDGEAAGITGGDDEDEEEAEEEDDDVEWATDTSKEAAAARAREQLSSETAKLVKAATDAAASSSAAGIAALSVDPATNGGSQTGKANSADDDDDDDDDEGGEEGDNGTTDAFGSVNKGVVAELRVYLVAHSPIEAATWLAAITPPPPEGLAAVAFSALLGPAVDSGVALPPLLSAPSAIALLSAVTGAPGSAVGQRALLVGLEHMCAVSYPGAAKQAATMIKALYDADVVEEAHIESWYTDDAVADAVKVPSAGGAAVRKMAFPFINWLRTADDDSDEA